jgi:hypothetical protein
MKVRFPLAFAAALIFGCSSSSKNTRTAGNDTGLPQSGSIAGTQGAAGGANGTQGSVSTATSAQPNNPSNPVPSNTANNPGADATASSGTTATAGTAAPTPPAMVQNPPSLSGTIAGDTSSSSEKGTTGTSGTSGVIGTGSPSGQTNPPSTGSISGSTGSTAGTSAAVASGSAIDNASLRTVTGAVAKVDTNSITLDQAAGGVTLTVDSQTQVLHKGQPIAAGISAIREGQQIRASFDPASNRADKIEVMARPVKHHKKSGASDSSATPPSDSGK